MYLDTSKDLLNVALAISVFGIAFILGWILIYFLIIIHHLIKLVESIENKVKKVDEFVAIVRQKMDSVSSYLPMLAIGIKELVSFFVDKKTNGKNKKK